jgi:hypothetical protein
MRDRFRPRPTNGVTVWGQRRVIFCLNLGLDIGFRAQEQDPRARDPSIARLTDHGLG